MSISIHAPRTGSDVIVGNDNCKFITNFNPRSPHGERRVEADKTTIAVGISIHAPRTGSDSASMLRVLGVQTFQSTLPARGATGQGTRPIYSTTISIHAPRTGSDILFNISSAAVKNFNPRSPHGERRHLKWHRAGEVRFQSTLPARGATLYRNNSNFFRLISIHAPRTGSDRHGRGVAGRAAISIHAPRTGSDKSRRQGNPQWETISIHAPRTGSDQTLLSVVSTSRRFQSTLPARGATLGFADCVFRVLKISIHAPRTGSDAEVVTT